MLSFELEESSTLPGDDLTSSLFPGAGPILRGLGTASVGSSTEAVFFFGDLDELGLFTRLFCLDCGLVCVAAVLTSLEYSRPPSDSMVRKCSEMRLEHFPQ